MRTALLVLIRLYQLTLSKLLGPRCRFYPSCSQYAAEAIQKHGAIRGTAFTLARIVRCHPWHPGGVDLVPDRVPPSSER
jgi:uncharacterized protein